MFFCGYLGPHYYVSMRKRGTPCIAPKLRGAHFEGSIIQRGALQRFPNSAGQRLTANLPRGVLDLSSCAPRSFGPLKVCPAEFWSNATCAPLSHGDIVMGAKISTKNHLKLGFSLFFKVIFVNRCHFRDLEIQWD